MGELRRSLLATTERRYAGVVPEDSTTDDGWWAEILAHPTSLEELERCWLADLAILFPDTDPRCLNTRFIAIWREVTDRRLPLTSLSSVLRFPPADLPGWQALVVRLVHFAGRRLDDEQRGLLAARLSTSVLQAMRSSPPPQSIATAAVFGTDGQACALPETWTCHGDMVGGSQALRVVVQHCTQAARDRYPVLISGETGSGKELVARLIHQLSGSRGPFIPVNCAALPEALIESELFGHERGAFTGATISRRGLFMEAADGTILLDEISEIPTQQQAKLLRVLQDGLVRPVGSTRHHPVHFRCLASTNLDLRKALEDGCFRRDLFYRLTVHEVRVPPLREHREDIPELIAAFITRWRRQAVEQPPPTFTASAVAQLSAHRWPGNVRQLENMVFHLCSCHAGGEIGAAEVNEVLGIDEPPVRALDAAASPETRLKDVERKTVRQALALAGGNKAAAARMLGVSRKTLYAKLRQYDLG